MCWNEDWGSWMMKGGEIIDELQRHRWLHNYIMGEEKKVQVLIIMWVGISIIRQKKGCWDLICQVLINIWQFQNIWFGEGKRLISTHQAFFCLPKALGCWMVRLFSVFAGRWSLVGCYFLREIGKKILLKNYGYKQSISFLACNYFLVFWNV